MNSIILSAAAAAMLLSAAAPALAQDINQREANQQSRVNQGEASGALTRGEATRDQRHLNSIDRQSARMRSRDGGHLTHYDRAVLNHRLNHDSNRIYRTKHNGRYR